VIASAPATMITMAITQAKIGRSMKKRANRVSSGYIEDFAGAVPSPSAEATDVASTTCTRAPG
jgi:hypothetical protein